MYNIIKLTYAGINTRRGTQFTLNPRKGEERRQKTYDKTLLYKGTSAVSLIRLSHEKATTKFTPFEVVVYKK